MSTASLSLLKKGNKTALAEELAKVDTVVVDPKHMTEAEIDKLVVEQGVETPIAWKEYGHGAKLKWLQENFGTDDADVEAAATLSPTALAEAAANSTPDVQTAVSPEAVAGALSDEEIYEGIAAIAEAVGVKPKKAKGKSKFKDVAVSTTKEGEILAPDLLQDLVHEIENLKEDQALAQIGELTEQTELTFFKLGGVLSLVQANGWFAPHASFKDFVENVHGLHYRRASYWIEIYNKLSSSGIPWSKVSKLGWTKLQVIAKALTVENVDEWVKVATEQNTLTLVETVKKALASNASNALEDQTAKSVTTMTFKVHEDQKATVEAAIAKAKEATGTAVSTAALEFICIEFMGTMTVAQRLKAIGIEKAIKEFELAFPDANLSLEMGDASETSAQ